MDDDQLQTRLNEAGLRPLTASSCKESEEGAIGTSDWQGSGSTGAGNGIGRAHALALAAEGAKVLVNDVGQGASRRRPPNGVATHTS